MVRKKYQKIIVTGSCAHDEVMVFPGEFIDYFQKDKLHQINISFVVESLEKHIGGTAVNICHNLRLLSDREIVPLVSLGRDNRDFIEFFGRNKISLEGIVIHDVLYSSTGRAITDKKNNQIWGFYYGAGIKAKEIDLKKIAKKDDLFILSASHIDSYLHFQDQAIALGIDYLYDPGMLLTEIDADKLFEGIQHCKYLIGNDYEISQMKKITGLHVLELIEKGTSVITTLGEKGVQYIDRENEYFLPAYKVSNPLDPTGAGDAFRAGFVAGLLEQRSIESSLMLGNAIASFAVENIGTINHHPKADEINERVLSIEKNTHPSLGSRK